MLYVLIFLNLLMSFSLQANPYNEEALKLLREAEGKKLIFLNEAETIKERANGITQELLAPKASFYDEEALKLSQEAEEKRKHFLNEAEEIKEQADKIIRETLTPKELKHETESCPANTVQDQSDQGKFLIFVSLSMPADTLKSLYREAETMSTSLLLRGLKNQSFKETAEYLKELGIGLQINPELFKKYHIQQVPTFVFMNGEEHQSLSGNVSFQFAKQKLLEANS